MSNPLLKKHVQLKQRICDVPISKKDLNQRISEYEHQSNDITTNYSQNKSYYTNLYRSRQTEIDKVSQIMSNKNKNNIHLVESRKGQYDENNRVNSEEISRFLTSLEQRG